MKKLLVVACLGMGIVSALDVDFIDLTMQDFAERCVPEDARAAFKDFYQQEMDRIKTLKAEKRDLELKKLRQRAICALEVRNPEWARSLQPYEFFERSDSALKQVNAKQIRVFLTRYGFYDRFMKEKAQDRGSLWTRVKSYSQHMKQKVTGIFNRNKKTVVA